MTYGYIRVSSKDQNEDRQLAALSAFAIPEKNLFLDKQSGKDFNRPAYRKLLKKLKPGDLLMIKSIDRLGRNYEEILQQWRYITKEIRADMDNQEFDYYYGDESSQFSFYRIPRQLVTNERFYRLSTDAHLSSGRMGHYRSRRPSGLLSGRIYLGRTL